LSSRCWKQKLPAANRIEKNPKLLSIHTQPKARNLLQGIHSHLLLCVQVKSQIGHEDLPLKGLGTIKSWSGELDKSQNLRSG
jgi:hypothetical protein